ncbi:MAG TPA: sialidase family protein [Acidimicrobiales bacterium]|nr:sialidase family protein [Acidimicrobiales bacterium]
MLADPDEPARLYAAGVELRSRRCTFHRSADGGRTWSKASSPSPAAYPLCSHVAPFMPMGALAGGSGGTVYYLHRGWSHQDEGAEPNSSILLSRSDDHGDTWRTSVVRSTRGVAPPGNEVNYPADVEVDTRGGADLVYVTWTTTYPSAVPRKPAEPTLSVSSDGGRSFTSPKSVAGSFFDEPTNLAGDVPDSLKNKEHFGGALPYLAMDDDGIVSVSWVRRTANMGILPEPRYLSRSADRGRTFTVTQMAPAGDLSNGGAVLAWAPGGTRSGSLHTVYEDKAGVAQGDRDVHYRRSADGGLTWSEPKVLNDDEPSQLFSQLLPTIGAAPDGRLDVTWWDTRDGLDRYATDVYYATSDDAGRTWSQNIRVTQSSVNRRTGSWVDDFGNARQGPALASGAAMATIVWDTIDSESRAASYHLHAGSLQYEPLPAQESSSAPTYLAAAVVGALMGAAVLPAGRRIRRWRMRTQF